MSTQVVRKVEETPTKAEEGQFEDADDEPQTDANSNILAKSSAIAPLQGNQDEEFSDFDDDDDDFDDDDDEQDDDKHDFDEFGRETKGPNCQVSSREQLMRLM